MPLRSWIRTTSALGIAALLAVVPLRGTGQEPLGLDSARVSIAGTSNIHAYTASTSQVRLTELKLAGPATWDALLAPGTLEAFAIAIPAASLTSPRDGLDKNMHKALKVGVHRDITFRLLRLDAGEPGALSGIGVLTIAGVEREVTLALNAERRDATLAVAGAIDLLMTDFGIAPPKAMLGMLKTDPKVTVTFEAVLSLPLS